MARTKKADDVSWLELPGEGRVEGVNKLPGEKKRAPSMTKRLLGKSRVWACDGAFVYFRRKSANPETLKRHEAFIADGQYKHQYTSDDVEVYELQANSPFKRKEPVDLTELDAYNLQRAVARAACRRDWVTYCDGLEEIAGRIKGMYHSGFAATMWTETLEHLDLMIQRRGGPSKEECGKELAAVRKRHKLGGDKKMILLPA